MARRTTNTEVAVSTAGAWIVGFIIFFPRRAAAMFRIFRQFRRQFPGVDRPPWRALRKGGLADIEYARCEPRMVGW